MQAMARGNPNFRGLKLGHKILKAILGTLGRAAALVILEASPVLTDDGPVDGGPEHAAAKALRRYWADYFQEAAGSNTLARWMADAFED